MIEAQDLGMAASINRASFQAFGSDQFTILDVLVPAPWFPEVARWERAHIPEGIGLQFDLNAEWANYRWRPISEQHSNSKLTDSAGYLRTDIRQIAQYVTAEDIELEFYAQIAAAKQAGLTVTHLDSHGGVVLYTPGLFKEYWKVAHEVGLPAVLSVDWVRQRGRATANPNHYDVGGTEVDLADVPFDRILQIEPGIRRKDWLIAYEKMLTELPAGVYLLQVHLGFNDEELQAMTVDHPNWGAQWRQNDYDVISSPEFHNFLKNQKFIRVDWNDVKEIMAERKATEAAHRP